MKGLSLLFFLFFSLLFLVRAIDEEGMKSVYIVYMGAAGAGEDHVQLLGSDLKRKENTVVHSYTHGFSGFAARLSEEEARTIAQKPGVISVFADPILQLHTTRSWDFLQYQTDLETDSNSGSDSESHGSDTILGILDTGIWPESESFNDKDMGPIPPRWKGVCMDGHGFSASNCNRKLIGARYYNDSDSRSTAWTQEQTARDEVGHGTHTASTAVGSSVSGASYYGLASGTAKGGSPGSRIAVYRVCTSNGCPGSTIMAGFDNAIGDGVDVMSLSLGASSFSKPDFSIDPIAIGAFHAVEKGITVVCSAGNAGPSSKTVVNAAPWILTVAATTIDRDFQSNVVLGGNKVVKGEAINFSNLQKSPIYPLIYGGSAKLSSSTNDDNARNCDPDALDGNKIKGKIVLCQHLNENYSNREKMQGVQSLGGIGLAVVDDLERFVAFNYGEFPMTVISSKDAVDILSYINSTKNPVATILPTVAVTDYKPAPMPDIAAPGVNILAAWIGTNDTSGAPAGQKPSKFNLLSGTSMACPHVSGIAATIKSKNPTWSPSAIRSAIMTTATQSNNEKVPITEDSGSTATPYDYGAGEISPSGALQPGLVYETTTNDYLEFLCNYGYKVSTIKTIASAVPAGFDCPKNSSKDMISNLNYPSIAISKFDGKESKKVSRTVTNVGADEETIYTATVKSPNGLVVKVIPDTLQFTKNNKKLSYQVEFSASSLKDDAFGSITWTNGKYKVRSVFAISSN
ncbi:hypothetical protein HHK36_010339 [Tetracentron sinense]|uniref:Uncharacterized protein n=1 Tax=Tetracentron sinense TaxID=13715 RepID=A0A835DJ31_TETSI|nr:hypothetical protein HHK36_010339 [Tetracentron sinense]